MDLPMALRGLSAGSRTPLLAMVCSQLRFHNPFPVKHSVLSSRARLGSFGNRQGPEFAQDQTFLSWRGFTHLLEGCYPFFIARTASRANPTGLSSPSVFGFIRGVFAGYFQALLPMGSSRRYSENLSSDA